MAMTVKLMSKVLITQENAAGTRGNFSLVLMMIMMMMMIMMLVMLMVAIIMTTKIRSNVLMTQENTAGTGVPGGVLASSP